jgi:lipid II:glycine glycyltransferase (peptidoglycan interpeptide bridge formation enzyme)
VFRTFKRTQVQQRILKAEKEGLTVRRAESWQAVADTFYRLHVSTRRRLGTPVQPKRYFRLLWERLVEPGLAFILVAYAGERAAAAAVFVNWNRTLIYKYSASDPDLWHTRPNNLVLWNAIRWGCENGYTLFDFGRTEVDNEGLRAFKRGWGTAESDLVYSTLGGGSVDVAGSGAMSLARPVIQRMPDWFCRAVGELGYRYAM